MSEQRHASLGIHAPGAAPNLAAARDPMYRRARVAAAAILGLLLVGALVAVGGRYARSRDLRGATDEQARNYVAAVTLAPGKGGESISQPATLQGFIESPIYARTAGYVLRWNRDIGARVSKGDILAELDTPEVDQQLAQASAAREQAKSSLELARSSAERWEHLRERDAVSQQELDERRSAYAQAQANLAAAEANVRRLSELEGFKHIVAPFSGVVTRRNIDVGDLVDAGSSGGTARSLFTLSQTDPLRVYVYLPQTYAAVVRVGQAVTITQAELSGQVFHGSISNTAGAIDTATRTMQVEIRLPNPDGRLLPGSYVDVQLPALAGAGIVAPSNALLFRPEGPRVALVDAQGKVSLRTVALGRDFGQTIELLSGVAAGEKIILNPADSLADGDLVTVQAPAAGAEPAAAAKPKT
jgi:RND family efflux transporter MFP subunit